MQKGKSGVETDRTGISRLSKEWKVYIYARIQNFFISM